MTKKWAKTPEGKASKKRDRETHKERDRKRHRLWYAVPENKIRNKENGKRWQQGEKSKAYKKAYFQRPEVKARMRIHRYKYEKGKGYTKKLLKNRIQIARRRAAGKLKPSEWEAIVKKYQGKCAYCGMEKKLTIDHVIPVAKGGKTIKENVVPACLSCNSKKRDKLIQPSLMFG
jgi:5-methylcytosine-specific restriction endonuclease McrA